MAADLFVLPTRFDIWGLVINEAMACGLPIVTTDQCLAGVELVNAENGRIVPIDDVGALEAACIEFIDNPTVTERATQSSLETIKDHTIENMAAVHAEILGLI
jgi:glycosyltransferase involved in cell wall biosynthesis